MRGRFEKTRGNGRAVNLLRTRRGFQSGQYFFPFGVASETFENLYNITKNYKKPLMVFKNVYTSMIGFRFLSFFIVVVEAFVSRSVED